MNRRQFGLMGGALAASGFAAPPAPRGVKPPRITKVSTVEVRGIPTGKGLVKPWDASKTSYDTRDFVVTQLFTDQGVVGTTMDGEYQLPAGIGAEVQQHAEAYFIGKDPFELEVHQAEFFAKPHGKTRMFFLEAGLWDIIGKTLGQPLYRLWGAASTRVMPYASTVQDKTPEERAEDVHKFYEMNFRAIKLRLHKMDEKDDLTMVRMALKAANGKMAVMFDANQVGSPPVWNYERALRMALELEAMGAYWLETPMREGDLDDLAKIRAHLTKMHLAGAEGARGLQAFRDRLVKGSYSYLQPDPMQGGTVSTVRKVAAMAEAFGVKFGPHHGKSGLGMVANLHMQLAAPNSGYLEYMIDPGFWNPEGFQAGFVTPYPVDKEGYMQAPTGPGLGIQWDRKFFQKYGLHFG